MIEGVSGTGKTTVCRELRRRGYHAINGDTDLAYQGDPETGEPTDGRTHEHHIWHVEKVKSLIANQEEALTFFCGGSRNHNKFLDLFDGVFILEVDVATLNRRLDERTDEWGHDLEERELVWRLHRTGEDLPPEGIRIDATAPVTRVVDDILAQVG